MDNSSCLKSFTCNIKEFVIDEIALEGLEGIGLDLLWRRLELKLAAPVLKKMQIRVWNIILSVEDINCYQLPVPAPNIELVDRFHTVHPESGQLLELTDYVDGPYEYCPATNDYGSCVHYVTRKLISKDELRILSYEKVLTHYGNTLVLVASIQERWRALASHMPISYLYQMATITYCVLELVGKSRKNGQMTCGKTNLTKVEKDPKMLFYYRKLLHELDLVTVQNVLQVTGGRSVSSILLRLKRFYEPSMMNLPKEGHLFQIIKHLSEHSDLSDSTEAMIKKGILTQKESKRLIKTSLFNTELREVSQKDGNKSNTKRYLCLVPQSDESSHSDEEDLEEQIPSQYNLKRNIMQQAYEVIANAGIRGVSMNELAQILGIEFYTIRTIIRLFKRIKIVRQSFTEKRKHKIARYIAATVTATDSMFEEEKQKLLNFLQKDQIESTITESASTSAIEVTDSEAEIPKKRVKLEDDCNNQKNLMKIDDNVIAEGITQINLMEGYEKFQNKNLLEEKTTLRQLKYANGVLRILKEHKVILGFVTLNCLVSKLINEPPMCTKTLKACVQTLTSNGQAKMFHLKWPGPVSQISVLICDPHVPPNDPKIKSIYKEICFKAIKNNKIKAETSKNVKEKVTAYSPMLSYKRYTKVQKLHEFLMQIIYFNDDDKYHSVLPRGYSSVVDIIPELSVELATRITTRRGLINISQAKIPTSMFQVKLKDVPKNIFQLFVLHSCLQAACMMNLRLLSWLGLVQIIEEFKTDTDNKIRISNIIYLNRRATLINTSGTWPTENVDKTLLKSYEFKNMQAVRRYWQDVYNISINTNVNVLPNERYRKSLPKMCSQKNEVEANDNGKVFGNGLGPCGFDGSFYMDMPRLWSNPKSTLGITMKKAPARLNSLRKRIKNKAIKKQPVVTTSTEKKTLKLSKPKTRIAKLKWSAQEDKIILLCSAATSIISPSQTTGSLNLRNVVAKDIISLIDKTKMLQHIHKRALLLDTITCLRFERDFLVNEIKRRQSLMQKYEGLFRKSKLKHFGVLSKTIASCRLPMMELVWILFQISTSHFFSKNVQCVAANLDEFNTKFTISSVATSGHFNEYKTTASDTLLAVIKECVILCLISYRTAVDNKLTTKIYDALKSYPEPQMRRAVEDLRKCNIVVLRDKRVVLKSSSAIDSSFKISEMYLRRWSSRFNTDFVDNMATILNEEIPSTIKGAPETICTFLELHSCDAVDLQMETVPSINSVTGNYIQDEQISVADIFSNHKLKSGVVGLKNKTNLKRFAELFEDLELNDALRKIISNSKIEGSALDVKGDKKILSLLNKKQASGSTFEELQNITGYDVTMLKNILQELEGSRIIKRVGYFENVAVLSKFVKAWSLNTNDLQFIPAPWFNIQMDFSYEVFSKWAGKIMDKVFRHPGCSIEYITRICGMISARSVQDVCEFLQSIQCVTLSYVNVKEPDLFSNDETEPEITEYNPFGAVRYILVFPLKNSLIKFTYVINKFKEYGVLYYGNIK